MSRGGGAASPDTARGALVDGSVVLALFVVLGLTGAWVWHAVVDLPAFERTADGGQMDAAQLSGIVGIDGWFFVIGAVGGLVGGIVVMLLRHHRPLLMVVLVLGGGALASWLMLRVGLRLGPPDPQPIVEHAKVGARIPVQLRPHADGVAYVWPFAALLGALLVLLVVTPRDDTEPQEVGCPP